MASLFPSYPIHGELNVARHKAWLDTHKADTIPRSLANALTHKELSALSLVSNVAAAGIGAAACTSGAVVLGTPKLVTFIVTGGIVRPEYSTGCIRNGGVVLNSATNIFLTALEITYDGGYVVYKAGKGAHWAAKQVGLGGTLTYIAKHSLRALNVVGHRLVYGAERAVAHEPEISKGAPMLVAWIDNPARNTRIDFDKSERPVVDIAAHLGLSVINLPVNAAACAGSAVAVIPLSTCFVSKVAINAVTNLDIPGPTGAGYAWVVCGKTFYSVSADIGTAAADVGVLTYKVTNILRINQIAATAVEFLVWSVGAIVS